MIFTLVVGYKDGRITCEDYENREGVTNLTEAHKWGENTIEWFNSTLRRGQKPRFFIGVLQGLHTKDVNIYGNTKAYEHLLTPEVEKNFKEFIDIG